MLKKNMYDGQTPFVVFETYSVRADVEIPAHTEQLDYDQNVWKGEKVWKDNQAFLAVVEIKTYSRGRSAANWSAVISDIVATDTEFAKFLEGCQVNIFMTDMLDILLHNELRCGKTLERLMLCFSKRGMNYGMCLYDGEV